MAKKPLPYKAERAKEQAAYLKQAKSPGEAKVMKANVTKSNAQTDAMSKSSKKKP